jgi:hypothetical protein
MSFELGTDDILSAMRTTVGESTTVGTAPDTLTVTWQRKLEGPPLRWINDLSAGYPLLTLEPQDTTMEHGVPGANYNELDLVVLLHAVIPTATLTGSGAAATAYRVLRLVGEQLVNTLMDAGSALGTSFATRRVLRFGIDYSLTEALFDKKLCVYSIECGFVYYEAEPKV